MPDHKGHKAEEDVDAETHQTQSRAAEGEEDGSYVGAAGSVTRLMPGSRAPKPAAKTDNSCSS